MDAAVRLVAHADHERAGRARRRACPSGVQRRRRRRVVVREPARGGRAHRRAAPARRTARRRGAGRAVERPHGGARVRRRRVVGARRRAVVRRLGDAAPPPASSPAASRCRSRPSPTCRGACATPTATSRPTAPTLLCVQEEHHADGREATNTIVRLAAHEPSRARGRRRAAPTSCPTRAGAPDGGAFCWLEWDHPDMPWDATRLVVDDGGVRTVVAGGDAARVDLPADVGAGRLAVVQRRPHRLLEPLPLDGRRRASRPMVDLGTDIGFPQWVFGQSCFALPRRRPGGVRATATTGSTAWRCASRRRRVTTLDVPHTLVDRAARRTGRRGRLIAASPTTEPHVVGVDARRRGGRRGRASCRPATSASTPAWFSVPEPIEFPTAGGAVAHALLLPADQPGRRRRPTGERPPLLVLIHGGPTAAARPMLQLARQYWTSRGLRGRRRQLPRLDRLRPRLPRPAAGAVGRRRRRGLRGRVPATSSTRGDVDPDRLLHPRRLGRRVHDAGRARLPRRVRGRGQPLRRRRPRRCSPRRRTSSRAATSTGSSARGPRPGPPTRSARRSTTSTASTGPLAVFQGLDDPIVPPNQAEMIVDGAARQGRAGGLRRLRGRAARLPPGRRTSAPSSTASCFYAQVLGFDLPADEGIEPIEVENL